MRARRAGPGRAVPWARRALRGVRGRPLLIAGVAVATAVNLFLTLTALSRLSVPADPGFGLEDRLLRIRIQAQNLKDDVRSGRLDLVDARRESERLRMELRASPAPEGRRVDAGYVDACLSLAIGENAEAERTLRSLASGNEVSRQVRDLLAIAVADRYFARCLPDPGEDVLAELKTWLGEPKESLRDDFFDTFEDGVNRQIAVALRTGWIEGDRDRAAARLQERLRRIRAAELLNMLARCQTENLASVEHHTRALTEAPLYRQALKERGRARFQAGNWSEAAADFSEAIRLSPEDAVAWANRGLARRAGGDSAEAEKDLTRALEIDGSLRRHFDSKLTPPDK